MWIVDPCEAMMPRTKAFLALGSNIGSEAEKLEELRRAVCALEGSPRLWLEARSSVYRSQAWGLTNQPDFLNAVIGIETQLTPIGLLELAKTTEQFLGRRKTIHWGPRLIDIDLLLYDLASVALPALTVPHPYLLERSFVVVPLLEIAPQAKMPSGQLIRELVDPQAMARELERIATL